MWSWKSVALAFLAFLLPSLFFWNRWLFWEGRPQWPELRQARAALRDAQRAGDAPAMCAAIGAMPPWLGRAADGELGERQKVSYRVGLELTLGLVADCHGGAPATELDAEVKRLLHGLRELDGYAWHQGLGGTFRVGLFVIVPVEIAVLLLVMRARRRQEQALADLEREG